jgi:hypothetical protein
MHAIIIEKITSDERSFHHAHMLQAARLQMLKFKSNLPDQDPFQNFDDSFKQVRHHTYMD